MRYINLRFTYLLTYLLLGPPTPLEGRVTHMRPVHVVVTASTLQCTRSHTRVDVNALLATFAHYCARYLVGGVIVSPWTLNKVW